MNVAEFLALPSSQDFQLIAGKEGMENIITSVNIMDNPHADDWLFAGELLVTSGYFFGIDFITQRTYFQRFKELNIAAVCIKPHIYYDKIPENIIAICQELAIPLIEIPYGIAFSKILKTVMNQLSTSVDSEKQFALDVHSQFFETALNGGGIDYLAKELAKSIENPVLIASTNWQILTLEGFEKPLLNTLIQQEETYVFTKQALNSLPTNIEQLKHPVYRKLLFQDQSILCCILPIFFNQTNYGYIIVYLTNRPLSTIDQIVLESCTMSVALEIVHQTEKERVNNRIRRDFFTHLLAGNNLELDTLKTFNVDINYELTYSAFIISTHVSSKKPPFLRDESQLLLEQRKKEEQLMHTLLSSAQKYIQNYFLDIHIFKQGKLLIGLLGIDPKTPIDKIQNKQRLLLEKFRDYLEIQVFHQVQFSILVGSTRPLVDTSKSYTEASNMLKIVKPNQTGIYFLNDFYLETFLSNQISDQDATGFTDHFLQPLIQYDQKNGSDFLETLSVYLGNHLNIASTSRVLFIHRNTLLYRLERIKEILLIDINDSTQALALQLSLKLYERSQKGN